MTKLNALVVCLVVCALFGVSFGQENDFRENAQSFKKRDLPVNPETVKPCLDAVDFSIVQTISKAYRGPISVTSADFNKDGRQDVAVAFTGLNRIVWYRNNGGDSWSANLLGTVNGASAVFAADLNGDGNVDIVATSKTDDQVYWFKNSLSSWTQYTVGSFPSPTSVFVADINGDTKPDIIAAGAQANETIAWFENNINNAAPSAWTSYPVILTGVVVDSVFAADINKDGFMDIVASSSTSNEVMWLDNSGVNFTNAPNIIAQPSVPVQVFCTDMDNDTYIDVMTVNQGDNSTTLYYNNLNNTHTAPTGNNSVNASSGWVGIYVSQTQNQPSSLFATDINGDGNQDIVVAINGSGVVEWYDAASLYNWTAHTAGNFTNPTYVFARDVDGDGAKDVIAASAVTNQVGWLEELCATSTYHEDSSSHVVGWATATGVIGGLLVLWILVAIVIAIRDFVKSQVRKESEKRKKEAKALVQPPEMHEDL